jgi:flagellar protein FlaJ
MNLRTVFRKHILSDPMKYHNLHLDMISARMGKTLEQHLWRSLQIAAVCGILFAVLGYLFGNLVLQAFGSQQRGFYNIFNLQLPDVSSNPALALFIEILAGLACFLVGAYIVYWALLRLPAMEKRNRATRINLTLHNAVAYIYAMRRGGAELMVIFRSLSDNSRIYGEVALEFRQIIRDAEFFGYDIITAIRHLSETTPSEKMKVFLEDLLSVIESGGDMVEFLSMRVRLYQEEAGFEQRQFLNFLSMVAESYVTLFVAGPLFLIIIMVVMGMVGTTAVVQLSVITYAVIPIGSLIFIILLDLMSIKIEKAEKYTRSKELKEYSDVQVERRTGEEPLFNQLVRYDRIRSITTHIRHPFDSFVRNVDLTLYVTVPVAIIYIIVTLISAPRYSDLELFIDVVDDHIILALLIVLIPYAIFYGIWSKKVQGIEALIPDFLERMAGINQVGLTIAQAISIMVNTNLGLLSYEIRRIKRDMDWGANFTEALIRFEERVSTPAIARTVTLITKASEMSGQIGEVLTIASSDAKMSEGLKRERLNEMLIYTVIIYLSFFVFLFVVAVLTTQFLPILTNITAPGIVGAGPLTNIGAVPITTFNRLLYHTCLVQAIFSGLIAGQMGEGSLSSGVKHSCVLLIIALVTFNYII